MASAVANLSMVFAEELPERGDALMRPGGLAPWGRLLHDLSTPDVRRRHPGRWISRCRERAVCVKLAQLSGVGRAFDDENELTE